WQVELFRWRSDWDAVTVFIYESDPDNFFTSRKHDPIFLGVVHRHDTVGGRIYASPFAAHNDAIARAAQPNGPALQELLWGTEAWFGAIRSGIPKIFLKLQTPLVVDPLAFVQGTQDIERKYLTLGGPSSVLGQPVSNAYPTPTLPGVFQHFENGSIY